MPVPVLVTAALPLVRATAAAAAALFVSYVRKSAAFLPKTLEGRQFD